MGLLVAILSDTDVLGPVAGLPPRVLPRAIFSYLKKADLILHAGDVGRATLLDELAAYASVCAVRGNRDLEPSVIDLPETLELELGGISVVAVHDSGHRRGRRSRLKRRFPNARAIIFGHSCIPGLEDEDGLLLLNLGSALSTLALLRIEEDGEVYGEIVDLESGTHHPAGHYPPLSTERPKGADFTAATKKLLLEKADHKCRVCSSRESLEFDHIVPVSEGGSGGRENGQVLCHRCHVEKTGKDRRRQELNERLEKEPARIIPDDRVDWVFETLSGWGASLPIRREELYGLTVERLVAKLLEKEADYLALDLVRGYLSSAHDKYYGIRSYTDL
ncbi:MAG: metallophosphoesterase family protein [Actinobacteria bacterium]|nr:metallophosphoesterase family protein [Actinomycetota bacterium]